MAKCKTCSKEFYNPYIKSDYCSVDCEKKEKKTEGDNFIEFFNDMIQGK